MCRITSCLRASASIGILEWSLEYLISLRSLGLWLRTFVKILIMNGTFDKSLSF